MRVVLVLLVWRETCGCKSRANNAILNIVAVDVKMTRAPSLCRIRAKGDNRHASG